MIDLPLDRLAHATAQSGLPRLVGARHHHTSGALDRWRLFFADDAPDLMLTRVLWNTGRDPLQCEAAAIAALASEDLPISRGLQILPDGSMPHPTALVTAPVGISARAQVTRAPRTMRGVLTSLGRIVAQLQEVHLPRFGIRGDGGQFAPTRAIWRDEWRALAEAQWVLTQDAGFGDLRAVARLWTILEEGLSGLPAETRPTLVHFGLRPQSLHLHVEADGPRLAHLGELHDALAGDPLAAWAPLLCRFGSAEMTVIVDAYGADRVRALRETDAVDRIGLYARTLALTLLRDAAQRARMQRSEEVARAVDRAVALCARVGEDGWVDNLLQGALDGRPSGPVFVAAPPAVRIEQRTLLGLAGGPCPPSNRAPYVLSAMACADLARIAEPLAADFVREGSRFVEGASFPVGVLPVLPVADRTAWRIGLIDTAARACGAVGPGLGLALLAAGLSIVDRFGDQVSSETLRGLEALVLATFARESARRTGAGLDAPDRVAHGLLGQDAAVRLNLLDLAPAWAAQVEEALDVLAAGGSAPAAAERVSVASLLPILAQPVTYAGRAMLTFPVASALVRLERHGLLEDDPRVLLRAALGR